MTTIFINELETLCHDVLRRAGLRESDVLDTTEHLLENELMGKSSHGLVRVIEAAKMSAKYGIPAADPSIEIDNGNMAVLNANRNIGVVGGKAAMTLAIERAKTHGIALVGVRNYIATSGSLTFYLRRLADAGLVALMGCNSVAMVAPPGGKKRKLGTNPFGVAIPGEDSDFIADLGTAAIAYGKIMVMGEKGESVPEGLMIDKDGKPSTNPKDAYDGAILPLAGHKGFALGVMVELLAGPLLGAKAVKQDLYDNDGLFIIAIDPKKMGHREFNDQISKALDDVKNDPGLEITLPGERSLAALTNARTDGKIKIADKTLATLREMAKKEAA